MFGRQPRLPVDAKLGVIPPKGEPSYPEYIKGLKARLEYAYKMASEHSKQAKSKQKCQYDVLTRGAVVQIGDKVLVRLKGKNKLADNWEQDIYVVIDQPNIDIPVYTVQKESTKGPKTTLHRNMLLPVGEIDPPERSEMDTEDQLVIIKPDMIQEETIRNPDIQNDEGDMVHIDDSDHSEIKDKGEFKPQGGVKPVIESGSNLEVKPVTESESIPESKPISELDGAVPMVVNTLDDSVSVIKDDSGNQDENRQVPARTN